MKKMGAQSSVQLPDANVEQRGVADPGQIGHEQQNRGLARRQSEHHERDDGQPEHQADDHREADLMRAEHGERPRAVEHELHNPRRERRAHPLRAPDQPSRYGDERVKHCPNGPEQPRRCRPGPSASLVSPFRRPSHKALGASKRESARLEHEASRQCEASRRASDVYTFRVNWLGPNTNLAQPIRVFRKV